MSTICASVYIGFVVVVVAVSCVASPIPREQGISGVVGGGQETHVAVLVGSSGRYES